MPPQDIAALLAPFLGGASLGETQLHQLQRYLDLLLRWNARMNLTAIRHPDEIVTRHFGESLFAAAHLYPTSRRPATGDCRLIDLGSGAGFPGLPMKIWAPPLHVTLLESNQRKATFLREVIRALQLADADVLTARAEDSAARIANHKSQVASVTLTFRAVERFDQILPTAVRILQAIPAADRRLALLMGVSQIEAARAAALVFSDPVAIPQSTSRVLLVGIVS